VGAETSRTYAYDLAGRPTTLTLPSDPAASHTTYAFDDAGLPISRTLPDGSVTSWGYDGAGRLTSLVTTANSGVIGFSYVRDANGRITSENSATFAYDGLGRLTSWYDPVTSKTTTYSYDAASNLTGVSADGSATLDLSFDDADRISSAGYGYDAAGNMTGAPGRTLRYDGLSRLSAVLDSSGTTIAAYAYDAFNRRVSSTEGTRTTFFHYDGAGPDVIAETDAEGTLLASYAYEASGRLHSMTRAGETYYYATNAHGDVMALTNCAGNVVATYRYDPWGRLLASDGTIENPYRYAGYRYDAATGYYHLWNRYYDPGTSRFLTRDLYPGELTRPASMNPYAYCEGDPANAVDPWGFWTNAVGYGASAFIPAVGGSVSLQLVSDDKGNVGAIWSGGWYGSTGWGVSVQKQATQSTACEVNDLAGGSVLTGASGGEVIGGGAELVLPRTPTGRRPDWVGLNTYASVTLGLPFESHVGFEDSGVVFVNIQDLASGALDHSAAMGGELLGGPGF
jgi:RHS repeat-associated protein